MPASAWPLVGRERELDRVAAALTAPRVAGVLLAGPAGVGKTRLAHACADFGDGAGFRSERVLATRAAAGVPLGALAPLLPPHRWDEIGSGLLGWAGDTLVAGGGPFLLVIDDAHLLDDASATVVHQLAGRDQTFVVMTARAGSAMPDAVQALWKDEVVERVDLGPLTRSEVNGLLSAVLGNVDGAGRRDLWGASQGNALFLRELMLGALDAGILVHDGGVWRLTRDLAGTPRLVELVEARLADLSADERRALELLALGEPLALEMLDRLGVEVDLIGRLESGGLVQLVAEHGRQGVRLAHPLHGDVLRERMTAIARMAFSRRLADAAEAKASGCEEVLRVAVWRLEGGGATDPTVMLEAARGAYFAHDHRLAERLARAAVEAGGGLPAGLLLAQVLGGLNRHDERCALLGELQSVTTTDEELAMVAMERALALSWGLARGEEARSLLATVEQDMAARVWREEVTAQRATLELLLGRLGEARRTAQPILDRDPACRAGVTAAIAVAPALAIAGRCDEAIAVADRALAAHLALGDQEVMSQAGIHIVARALALGEAGRLAEAAALIAAGYEGAVAARIPEGQAWFALMHGRLALLTGRLARAARWFSEGAAVFGSIGQAGPRRWCLAGRALAAAQRSDDDQAAAAIADLDAVGPNPTLMMEPDVLRARAWDAALRSGPTTAWELLRTAAGRAEAMGAHSLATAAWHDVARLGAADQATGPLDRLARLVDGPLAQARATHAAALARHDPDGLAGAAEHLCALGADLFAAEAAAAACAAQRRRNERRAAERLAQRSAALAARCEGAATPALTLAGPAAGLTTREHEVATLAARGLSSKAIAQQLVLSVRTVDSHLQRAYVKLGVTSRAELAGALTLHQPGQETGVASGRSP